MDPAEIREALDAFQEASSPDALEEAVSRVPALSMPVLHAVIRQEFLRMSNAASPELADFAPRYWDYFRILHERWYLEIADAARAARSDRDTGHSAAACADRPAGFLPPFWAALRAAAGDELPAQEEQGPTYDPAESTDGLRGELRGLFGRDIPLPAYEPADGSSWCAVIVRCAGCGRRRLDVRAFKVDLVTAPDLAGPLRDGRINNCSCPACGEACAYPLSVPVMETPGPEDPLAALSCVWRLAPNLVCYQPPPGTTRDEDKDRILEVRCDALYRVLSWPDPPGCPADDGTTMITFSVAYSPAEVAGYLGQVTGEAAVPFAMDAMAAEFSRKVASGLVPLSVAIDDALAVSAQVGRDWPLSPPGPRQEWQGPPLEHLILSLIAEGVAQAQARPHEVRAVLASFTAWSLIAMGEDALAEAALVRAEDSLPEAAPGDLADLAQVGVAEVRAHLLEIHGRYEEGAAIRAAISERHELQRGNLTARLAAIGTAGNQGLHLFHGGQHAAALRVFEQCIADREAILDELASAAGGQPADDAVTDGVRHGLSGDLANMAAVLTEVAEADPGAGQLKAEAESLLRRALDLSTATEGWEFAGIQAHRLAGLCSDKGELDEAAEFAALAVEYASRAGDHDRVWSALAFLINRELERGDGPRALGYLETGARHRIRREVGRGHHTELLTGADSFAAAAFQAVAVGGDPLSAVMIVESMRAASTAASLVAGTPYQLGSTAVPEPLEQALANRERLRLHLTLHPDDSQARTRLREAEDDLDQVRTSLAVRDRRFGRWVDASDVDLAAPESMIRRLAEIGQAGAQALWFGALLVSGLVWTWTVGADGAADVASRPFPQEGALTDLAEAMLFPHAARLGALRPADKLVISVAGPLADFPFAALPFSGRPLCEQAEIITVQGFGMFEVALSRPRVTFESFALVGAPRRPDARPLRGAEREIAAIAAMLSDTGHEVRVVNGPDATKAALVSAASSHDVIHVACHAGTDLSGTGAVRLMLSPDPELSDSGDMSEDLVATALTLRPGALVNLAACSTALTRDEGAPLLGGLVPAFLLAGAGCVIASLWPIADAAAARFQLDFYRQLTSGARPAAALAATQRRCLHGDLGDGMQDLEIWAAYVSYGGR